MGCRLIMLFPDVAARSCSDCKAYLYLDQPGKFGEAPIERGGKKVRRQPGQRTPCAYCPKQPPWIEAKDRTPATAGDLSEKNWVAYRHYLECKAVGSFPDDPIVRQNAGIIRQAEDVATAVRALNVAVLSRGPQ